MSSHWNGAIGWSLSRYFYAAGLLVLLVALPVELDAQESLAVQRYRNRLSVQEFVDEGSLAPSPVDSRLRTRLHAQSKHYSSNPDIGTVRQSISGVQELPIVVAIPEQNPSRSEQSSNLQTLQEPESHLGRQATAGNEYELDSMIRRAMENHPVLAAARARVDAAKQEGLQAGLYPNPQLGFFADEVGNENDPGLIGFYLQRKVIRGQKREWSREIKHREASVLEMELLQTMMKVETDVRTAFYNVIISQRKLELTNRLFEAQKQAIEQTSKLFDAGEAPKTDLLQTQLQAQKTNVLVSQTEVELQIAWRKLRVVMGEPELVYADLDGSLDEVIDTIEFEQVQSLIFDLSPELKRAHAEVDRVKATIQRAVAQTVPDYQTQVRVGKDSTTEHFFAGVQVQVPLMICDRNQGNIAAAKSRLTEATSNVERVKRQLTQRLVRQYEVYQSAAVKTRLYDSQLLPRAQKNLELLMLGYPEEVEFLQVLSAQQVIVEFTLEYLDSLKELWASRLRMEGLLLDESLAD